jgi:hypothetical protein
MCPVAPFGLHLSMLLIHQLRPDDGTPSAVLRWLQEATGVPELGAPLDTLRRTEFWRDANATFEIVPHRLAGVALGLCVRALLACLQIAAPA